MVFSFELFLFLTFTDGSFELGTSLIGMFLPINLLIASTNLSSFFVASVIAFPALPALPDHVQFRLYTASLRDSGWTILSLRRFAGALHGRG